MTDYTKLIKALRNNADHYAFAGENGLTHLLFDAADAIEYLQQNREQELYDFREEIINTLSEHKRSMDMRDRYGDYGMGFSEAFKIVCMMPLPAPPKEREE